MPSKSCLPVLFILALGLSPGSALGVSTATSVGTASCAVIGTQRTFVNFGPTTAGIVQAGCDVSKVNFDQNGNVFQEQQVVVLLNAVHSLVPTADVLVSVKNFQGFPSGGSVPFETTGLGQVDISYEADLGILKALPFIAPFPIDILSKWSMERTGPGTLTSVSASFVHLTPFPQSGRQSLVRNSTVAETIEGTFAFDVLLDLNLPLELDIRSSCNIRGTGLSGVERRCQSVIDPILVFDQAAFDAMHGANSFILEDFLEIRLSANLPEPGSTALLLVGALAVGILHRRAA